MGKCVVPLCLVSSRNIRKKMLPAPNLFRVPKDPETRRIWARQIHSDCSLNDTDAVCSLHFSKDVIEEFYETKMPDGSVNLIRRGRATLKPGAIPTIFFPELDQSSTSKKKLSKKRKNYFSERNSSIPEIKVELQEISSFDKTPAGRSDIYFEDTETSFDGPDNNFSNGDIEGSVSGEIVLEESNNGSDISGEEAEESYSNEIVLEESINSLDTSIDTHESIIEETINSSTDNFSGGETEISSGNLISTFDELMNLLKVIPMDDKWISAVTRDHKFIVLMLLNNFDAFTPIKKIIIDKSMKIKVYLNNKQALISKMNAITNRNDVVRLIDIVQKMNL